ncbi:MAG: hypothetical protein A2622_07260 [Bdellovibrionales bacterium RIFCSPHIGHO2_01_FULL_40_29]|nr:MAG: hypothetical protein A2622_07260 [Bdellovibrionales bacterium RIFCSPHIGHO2_01_FULL_40_29]OFZ33205.1 MAG: hypothetical protein A3D17_11520 [Bdellovibrionales bacterium RIFCSPHIGHO2_02_FULL_40_15]
MSKNAVFLVSLMTLIFVFGFWIYQNQTEVEITPPAPPTRDLQQKTSTSILTKPSTTQLNVRLPAPPPTPSIDLIEIEKETLSEKKQRLDILRAQREKDIDTITVEYPDLISRSSVEIANLNDLLEAQRNEESRLDQLANSILSQQQNLARLGQDQIEPIIRNLENQVQQIQEQINFWHSATYITPIEKQTRLQALEENFITLSTQLASLQNQSIAISSSVIEQSQAIASLVQQEKNQLATNQVEIQDYIYSLRNEIARLQNEYRQSRGRLSGLDAQVKQAENEYQQQLNRIQEIENNSRIE